MGASSMASGRNPSMLRMITRLIAGCGVCVIVGIRVAERVNMRTGVIVGTVVTGITVAPAVNAGD